MIKRFRTRPSLFHGTIALLVVAGFLLHVFQNGSFLEALAGGEHAGRPFPPGTVMLYACAIVAGGWLAVIVTLTFARWWRKRSTWPFFVS